MKVVRLWCACGVETRPSRRVAGLGAEQRLGRAAHPEDKGRPFGLHIHGSDWSWSCSDESLNILKVDSLHVCPLGDGDDARARPLTNHRRRLHNRKGRTRPMKLSGAAEWRGGVRCTRRQAS